MTHKHIAWMECKPAERSFKLVFGSRAEGKKFAKTIGAEIIEWRRGN